MTLIMFAAAKKNLAVLLYLVNKRQDISILDETGCNILHLIVLCNNNEVSIEMLKNWIKNNSIG